MSDSTSTAREPSMEDILASIRRIIDEEDTRDARPASDLAVDTDEDGGEAGSLPVMAAAAVDRDDETRERAATEEGDDSDSIFPERESLFWSRATGRGNAGEDGASDDTGAQDAEGGEAEAGDGPRTDIFRRAQSKLGAIARPGARERIQSLSARAGERAETRTEDREDLADFTGSPDHTDDDAQEDTADAVAALAEAQDRDADGSAEPHDSNILELTNPLDPVGQTGEEIVSRFDGLSDDEDRMDMARDAASHAEEEAGSYDPEALRGMVESVGDGHAVDADDVLDLTTLAPEESPTVEEGNVESGASFHVSGVDEADTQGTDVLGSDASDDDGQDIEEAISLNLGAEDASPVESEAHRDAGPEDDERRDANDADEGNGYQEARVEDGHVEDDHDEDTVSAPLDAVTNTYSRFDSDPQTSPALLAGSALEDGETRDDDTDTGHAATDETDERAVAFVDDTAEEEEATLEDRAPETGFAATDDAGTDDDEFGEGEADTVQEREEEERVEMVGSPVGDATFDASSPAADPYAAAFMMMGDNPPADGPDTSRAGSEDEDQLEIGDELGFSDTFSASDVYHDDPPVLDEDYSRSLDVEDEPVSGQAAEREDDSQDDDGMEKVGGLVRDAMERDPVDYADPSALVSMTSEEISARALASLADMEGEASRRMFGSLRISDDDGSESLEGMVRGMLRPLLREWLDDNLPNMVETAVRGEVERISAKSRKYSRAADKD